MENVKKFLFVLSTTLLQKRSEAKTQNKKQGLVTSFSAVSIYGFLLLISFGVTKQRFEKSSEMSHSSFSILALFHQFLSQLKLSLIKFSRDQKHKNRKKKQLRMTSLNIASRFVFLLLISFEVT